MPDPDPGAYYTPREIIELIDPACGSGGFLAAACQGLEEPPQPDVVVDEPA